MRVIPIAWNMIQKQCQDQSCLFLWGD